MRISTDFDLLSEPLEKTFEISTDLDLGVEEPKKKKERRPYEIYQRPFLKLADLFKPAERKVEKVGKKVVKKAEPHIKKVTEKVKPYLETPTAVAIQQFPEEFLKDIGRTFVPYLPQNVASSFMNLMEKTEAEIIEEKARKGEKAYRVGEAVLDSTARFLADPATEYTPEGDPTLFPKIRAGMLLGVLLFEGVKIGIGVEAGIAYKQAMKTFEAWQKSIKRPLTEGQWKAFTKTFKWSAVKANIRTALQKVGKLFGRKPSPTDVKLQEGLVRTGGHFPHMAPKKRVFRGKVTPIFEKGEMRQTFEQVARKNIEYAVKQKAEVTTNLRKMGFQVDVPAHYMTVEDKAVLPKNLIIVTGVPSAKTKTGVGAALADVDAGWVRFFTDPKALKSEIIRLSLEHLARPKTAEEYGEMAAEAIRKGVPEVPKERIIPEEVLVDVEKVAEKAVERQREVMAPEKEEALKPIKPKKKRKPSVKITEGLAPTAAQTKKGVTAVLQPDQIGHYKTRIKEDGFDKEDIKYTIKADYPRWSEATVKQAVEDVFAKPKEKMEMAFPPTEKYRALTTEERVMVFRGIDLVRSRLNRAREEADLTTVDLKAIEEEMHDIEQSGYQFDNEWFIIESLKDRRDIEEKERVPIIKYTTLQDGLKIIKFTEPGKKVRIDPKFRLRNRSEAEINRVAKNFQEKMGLGHRNISYTVHTAWTEFRGEVKNVRDIQGRRIGAMVEFYIPEKTARRWDVTDITEASEPWLYYAGVVGPEMKERVSVGPTLGTITEMIIHELGHIKWSPSLLPTISHHEQFGWGTWLERERLFIMNSDYINSVLPAAVADAKTEMDLSNRTNMAMNLSHSKDKMENAEIHRRLEELEEHFGNLEPEQIEEYFRLMEEITDRIAGEIGDKRPESHKKLVKPPLRALQRWQRKIAQYINNVGLNVFDIERPWRKIGAHETGWAIKNFFTRQAAGNEFGLYWINRFNGEARQDITGRQIHPDINRLLKEATDDDYIDAFYIACQRDLLKKEIPREKQKMMKAIIDVWSELQTFEEKRGKKLGVFPMGWVERVLRETRDQLLHTRAAVEKKRLERHQEKSLIPLNRKAEELQGVLDFFRDHDIRYVYLPIRELFEGIWTDKDQKKIRYLIFNRFFRKRETLDVVGMIRGLAGKTYTDPETKEVKELLNRENLDIRRIAAGYCHKMGRLYALASIVNSAKHDKIIRTKEAIVPSGWVTLPSYIFPEFKGMMCRTEFAEYMEKFMDVAFSAQMKPLPGVFAYSKVLQFDNPFFLGMYDLYQAWWLWIGKRLITSPMKIPKYFGRAAVSLANKDKDYWDYYEYGTPSQPYTIAGEAWRKRSEEELPKGTYNKLINFLKSNWDAPLPFISAYMTSLWRIAWYCDRFIRLASFHALRDEGYEPKEAAQLAALFHSDYARVPSTTRRFINKIFFTPVFLITMTMVELSMIKAMVEEVVGFVGKPFGLDLDEAYKDMKSAYKLRKKIRHTKAAGLLALAAGYLIRKWIQKLHGFTEADFGVRYVKVVPDPDNPNAVKELVKYIPTPDNLWLRHYFRMESLAEDPEKLKGAITRVAWTAHPIWRTAIEILNNRRANFEPIYDITDVYDGMEGRIRICKDIMYYGIINIIRAFKRLDRIMDPGEKKKAEAAFGKEVSRFWRYAMSPFVLVYMRNTKDRRMAFKARVLYNAFRDAVRAAEKKGKPVINLDEKLLNLRNAIENMQEGFEGQEGVQGAGKGGISTDLDLSK